MNNHKNS